MDRTFKISASIVFLVPALALAGASFAQPEKEAPLAPGEVYPESRFGRPPVKLNTGVSTNYAARAVSNMEAPDEELSAPSYAAAKQPSRNPAGLVFADAHASEQPAETSEAADAAPAPAPAVDSAPALAVDPALNPVKRPPVPETASLRKGVQEVALIAGDLGFFPKTVFVSRDVPVRMFVTGASKNTLCIMMDSFQVRRQVRSNKIEEITFTPNLPGKYRFYCPVNGMEGTMIVKEFATNFTADDVNR